MSDDEADPIPHVQRQRVGGKVYLYFRKDGFRERLTCPDGSDELRAEVDAILARIDRAEAAQAAPKPGTVGGALKGYAGHVKDGQRVNASQDFLDLARSTQAGYADIVDELIEDCGDQKLAEVTREWAADMRDAWRLRGHRVANVRLSIMANALDSAIEDGRVPADPFSRLKRAKRPRGKPPANPPWTDDEVEAGIEDAIARGTPGLARAIALGRFGGFRRGTICAIPRFARMKGFNEDGAPERRLNWITEKRQVLCDKREDARLTALLARTPDKALTIAYNADGHPWKERALNHAIDRHMARLAKAGRVRAVAAEDGEIYCPLTIHGLRHARGVEIALAGGSDAEIMAQLEHATARQAALYRAQADRRKLADAGQDRIDNVVSLRKARAKLREEAG